MKNQKVLVKLKMPYINKKIFLTLVVGVFLLAMASSATYYVSPTGNDSDAGNLTEPWASISAHLVIGGSAQLSNGDVLYILNGSYNESPNTLGGLYFGSTQVDVIGESREGVIINMTADNNAGFYQNDGHLSIYNLTVINDADACFTVRGTSVNVIIKNTICKEARDGVNVNYVSSVSENLLVTENEFIGVSNPFVLDSYGKVPINATYFNNIINYTASDPVYTGESGVPDVTNAQIVSEALINGSINISGNTFNLYTFTFETYTPYYWEENTINYEKIKFHDFEHNGQYEFANKIFNYTGFSLTANDEMIYFDNSDNVTLNNISFCSMESPCKPTGDYLFTAIYADSVSHNIIVNNSHIYVEHDDAAALIDLRANYSKVINSITFHNATGGKDIYVSNHGIIDNTTNYIVNRSSSYGLFCGSESFGTSRTQNCSITNSVIYANWSSSNTGLHTLFLGYTEDSKVINNTIYGGGYGLPAKGNINGLWENISVTNPSRSGLIDKGGINNTFRDITFYEVSVDSLVIYPDEIGEVEEMRVFNDSFYNITFNCVGTCDSLIYENSSVLWYDVTGYSGITMSGGNVTIHYSVDVNSNPTDVSLEFIDNLTNSYGYTSEDTIYLKSLFLNSTGNITYSPYTYTASKTGYESETGSFNLVTPTTLEILLEQVVSSGGSGTIGDDTIKYEINLYNLTYDYGKWFIGEENEIKINIYDFYGNLFDPSSIKISSNESSAITNIFRKSNGKYLGTILVTNKSISEINFSIIAMEGTKEITKEITINLIEPTTLEKIGKKASDLGIKLSNILKGPIGYALIVLILSLIMIIIYKSKK